MFDSAFSVVSAILALGLLIAVHELGHFLVALATGMRVIRFSIGFGPVLLKWKHKGVEYALSAIPLGGYVHVFGMNPTEPGSAEEPRSYQNRPRWARALVVVAGPVFSYGLGVLGYFGFFYGGQTAQELVYAVAEVVPGSAAEAAGLQAGDKILTLDGKRMDGNNAFGAYIDSHKGQTVAMSVEREGERLELSAQLPAESSGKGVLGIRYGARIRRAHVDVSVGQAIQASLVTTAGQTLAILSALGRLFTKPAEVEVGGPPEIVRQLKKSAERGLLDFIWLVAGLSVMFGLLNAMPVPALDGSKLFVLGIEAVARRDVPARFQIAFHGVGFMLLLMLMIVFSVGDIWSWMSP